jgi:hypothetical protein
MAALDQQEPLLVLWRLWSLTYTCPVKSARGCAATMESVPTPSKSKKRTKQSIGISTAGGLQQPLC